MQIKGSSFCPQYYVTFWLPLLRKATWTQERFSLAEIHLFPIIEGPELSGLANSYYVAALIIISSLYRYGECSEDVNMQMAAGPEIQIRGFIIFDAKWCSGDYTLSIQIASSKHFFE